MASDELVLIDHPPGPAWSGLAEALWRDEVPFLPIDHRITDRERRAIVDRARPQFVRDTERRDAPGRRGAGHARRGRRDRHVGAGGVPKLVELHRVAVVVALTRSAKRLGATPGAPWVCPLPPSHIGGLLVLLRAAVLGSPVVAHERFDPERVVHDGEGAAFVSVVPSMVRRLVEADLGLHGLTLLVGGGPSTRPRRAPRVRAAPASSRPTASRRRAGGFAYDGEPLDGMRVRLDPAGGIEVAGSTLMEGYRLDPAATGAAFTTDGWLRTGDLGAIGDDARVSVHGRADDLIRTGAEKVWPEEVEAILAAHPKVADVAVAGQPDPEWGERVEAYAVPATLDDPPSLDELRAFGADHLAGFKLPRELHLVGEIPRTRSGKVRRRELR